MPAPRYYEFEQRSGARGAVVRIGDKGGKRIVAVYKSQTVALQVMDLLNNFKKYES